MSAIRASAEVAFAIEPSFGGRTEVWRDSRGRYQDPPDGSPAVRRYLPSGSVSWESHCQNGKLQDPPDGIPAVRWYYQDGAVESEEHYQDGYLQDLPDGTPAVRWYHQDRAIKSEKHYQDGLLQDLPVDGEEHFQAGQRIS